MLVFWLVSSPGNTGFGELVWITTVNWSFTSIRSKSSNTLVSGRRNNARSRDPFTLVASIKTPLWNLIPSRMVTSQVVGSTWTAPDASQGSGLRLLFNLNNVSARPVGTASQPA